MSLNSVHDGSLRVFNKQQSTVSDEIGYTQNLDTSVDKKLTNDGDSTSIFSKVVVRSLSHGSSADLYLRCWIYLRVTLSEPSNHILWSWGSRPSTHWMNSTYLLPRYQNQKSNRCIPLLCSRSFFCQSNNIRNERDKVRTKL